MKGQCECGHKVKSHLAAMDRGHSWTLLTPQSLIATAASHDDFDLFLTPDLCLEKLLRWWVALATEEKKDRKYSIQGVVSFRGLGGGILVVRVKLSLS